MLNLLLHAGREDGLKMRALLFAGDDADLDVAEAAFFQELVELRFAEAEPVVGVEFARFFELMAEQIENRRRARRALKCDAPPPTARSG